MENTKRKRLLMLCVSFFLCIAFFLTACSSSGNSTGNRNPYDLKVEAATTNFYVNDFANILSDSQESDMMTKAVSMDNEYSGIQVVLTTVESLDKTVVGYNGTKPEKFEIEQVAYAMFNQYGIGQNDMGILILFSSGDREIRIETGRQMQAYITDSMSGEILDDYGMEYFRNDQFADGLVSVQNAVINEIKEKVPNDWNSALSTNSTEVVSNEIVKVENSIQAQQEDDSNNSLFVGIIAICLLIFGLISLAIVIIRKKINENAELEFKKAKMEEALADEKKKRERDLASQREKFLEELRRQKRFYDETISDLKQDYEADKNSSRLKNEQLQRDFVAESEKNDSLSIELEEQKDKLARAQALHPEINFEKEIQEMIESELKAAAAKIDEELSRALNTPADKDQVEFFGQAIKLYVNASSKVKKYITSDIQKLNSLQQESISLKREFERTEKEKRDREISSTICDQIRNIYTKHPNGTYETYDILKEAYRKYTTLTVAQQEFFPNKELIQKLRNALATAERDHKNYHGAKKAEKEVQSIIGRIYHASEDDRDEIERAMRCYNNLSAPEKHYFSADLLQKLKKLKNDAEADYRRKEAERERKKRQAEDEERRRRMQSSSFNSTNRGGGFGGGFSGHGGRSGGGGASRGF